MPPGRQVTAALPQDLSPKRRKELARALQSDLRGEVRFDAGSRALYSVDASNYRHLPVGVVLQKTEADVIAAVAIGRDFGVAVLPLPR